LHFLFDGVVEVLDCLVEAADGFVDQLAELAVACVQQKINVFGSLFQKYFTRNSFIGLQFFEVNFVCYGWSLIFDV